MRWPHGAAVVVALLSLAVAPCAAQHREALRGTLRIERRAEGGPSGGRLLLVSAVGGTLFAVTGFTAGLLIDDQYCKHHPEVGGGDVLFDRCFAYVSTGTAVGWFGGSVAGAAFGAARIAEGRGCPRGRARMRALAGAVIGVIPGAIIAAGRPGRYPPGKAFFVVGAPLLAGSGAALAVVDCRSER